ncbi:MAG: serine/threonine-protein phosphatase [Pyrinomonadaceae bacterium]|nr:serine/threonine-protein phosphatase [Pyrinomonadaceae bacterium]
MKNESKQFNVEVASITDRGLSEKRPVNEDSFLADSGRCIFAVADGVGGAESGEVASRTAVEVLDEAFRHHKDGEDVEDLMEIAIQRANASIHQMSREHAKLSMMATTFVGLHLDSYRATIGHVGDSRLYRLDVDGKIHRETDDHSVVEEEVRAGRMTEEQAINHPNRNIISRALGAEPGVEADMKTIDVEDGTVFLLCSDGITRHVPDEELRTLLLDAQRGGELQPICDELKRRCYERGAEDNLTAVIIRLGAPTSSANTISLDDERTLSSPPASLAATMSGDVPRQHAATPPPSNSIPTNGAVVSAASLKIDLPGDQVVMPQTSKVHRKSFASTLAKLLGVLLLLSAASVLAFYAGRQYERRQTVALNNDDVLPSPSIPPPLPTETPRSAFQERLREVDSSPREAIERMKTEKNERPQSSTDPQFLYLYGRALMNDGQMPEARSMFRQSLNLVKERKAPGANPNPNSELIASVERDLSSNEPSVLQNASKALEELVQHEQSVPQNSPPAATTTMQN